MIANINTKFAREINVKVIQSLFRAHCLNLVKLKIIQETFAFPPLYRRFFRLLGTKNSDNVLFQFL